MKIGILTLQLINNYGGILQGFALQRYLKKQGHEVYTISYKIPISPVIRVFSLIKRLLMKLRGREVSIRGWTTSAEDKIINQHVNKFIRENIKQTDVINIINGLPKLQKKYSFDCIVVGSDQCWKPYPNKRIRSMFLKGLEAENIIRIAYAVSFGEDFWEYSKKQTRDCKKLVKRFDIVSVREESGISLCRDFFHIRVEHLIDPTLLIDREEYESFINVRLNEINNNEKTIMAYILDKTSEKERIIEYMEKKLNAKRNVVEPISRFSIASKKNIHNCIVPPIEEWIRGFVQAEYVITDSFHGTVFALIFNKPFLAIANKHRGLTRFTSLLKLFGLEERLINNLSDITEDLMDRKIDFEKINKIILKQRKRTDLFFNQVLSS